MEIGLSLLLLILETAGQYSINMFYIVIVGVFGYFGVVIVI